MFWGEVTALSEFCVCVCVCVCVCGRAVCLCMLSVHAAPACVLHVSRVHAGCAYASVHALNTCARMVHVHVWFMCTHMFSRACMCTCVCTHVSHQACLGSRVRCWASGMDRAPWREGLEGSEEGYAANSLSVGFRPPQVFLARAHLSGFPVTQHFLFLVWGLFC